jgi:formylglycine-generating enzyme required for sulfatase activity
MRMKTRIVTYLISGLALFGVVDSAHAQVAIPDPGLDAAVRLALQKPAGALTQQDMLSLQVLSACCREIENLQGLEAAQNLRILDVHSNALTNADVVNLLTNLQIVDFFQNHLTSFTLSNARSSLTIIDLAFNSLAQCSLPNGLTNLDTLFLQGNQLANLSLPAGLTHLAQIEVSDNLLTNLTLPPDMTQLITLSVEGNPLTTLVLSDPLATTNIVGTVSLLRDQGVSVLTYPLEVQLVRPLATIGAFKIGIKGPPGVYSVLGSTNLTTWSAVGVAGNPLGSVNFIDVTANAFPTRFYRAVRQGAPANMVLIPANTFTMGTPATEVNRQADEGPQTAVTLSREFWIGKYEVTQREYQAVMGSNPSQFTGDLNRPVETVSWLDATNYCAKLTQLELAAGRISPGSRYRLPTEAEWECAARAGTTTRFSYGDDPGFTALTNHAWYWFNSGFGTHPVGQKAPNPWGLYDMEGNVLEWTQDWYGPYPGGTATDPQGPASNALGAKVIRGGAWDAGEADCRSGRRMIKGVHPFITDFILGFRVVLVTEPQ